LGEEVIHSVQEATEAGWGGWGLTEVGETGGRRREKGGGSEEYCNHDDSSLLSLSIGRCENEWFGKRINNTTTTTTTTTATITYRCNAVLQLTRLKCWL